MSADIASLRYVLERDPASALFYDLAAACSGAERWEEAGRVLKAGLAFHPEHLEARLLLGLCLARLNDPAGARSELEAAAGLLGRVAGRLYPELAAVCEEAGDPERGLALLRLALAYGPLPPEAAERCRRLEERLRLERSKRAGEEAVALMAEGQAEAAEERLREALAADPENAGLQARLKEASELAVRGHEAGQVIAVLQRWLQNIKEEAAH